MNKLPHKVVIRGANRAIGASAWCNRQFKKSDWDISMPIIGSATYQFSFADDQAANWFTLKWL